MTGVWQCAVTCAAAGYHLEASMLSPLVLNCVLYSESNLIIIHDSFVKVKKIG